MTMTPSLHLAFQRAHRKSSVRARRWRKRAADQLQCSRTVLPPVRQQVFQCRHV